jgi:hypothetical protein
MNERSVEYPIEIVRGITFDFGGAISYLDEEGEVIPLTDYVARMQIRSSLISSDPPIVDLVSQDAGEGQILGITIDEEAGTLTVVIPSDITREFDLVKSGRYSLVITSPGSTVIELIKGPVCISPGVVRDDET